MESVTIRMTAQNVARIDDLVEQGEFKDRSAAIRFYVRSGLKREMINA